MIMIVFVMVIMIVITIVQCIVITIVYFTHEYKLASAYSRAEKHFLVNTLSLAHITFLSEYLTFSLLAVQEVK